MLLRGFTPRRWGFIVGFTLFVAGIFVCLHYYHLVSRIPHTEDIINELPDKIVRFDIAVIEYGKQKLCQHDAPRYEVDCENKLVKCKLCGAFVGAFEALVTICRQTERWDDYREKYLAERNTILKLNINISNF